MRYCKCTAGVVVCALVSLGVSGCGSERAEGPSEGAVSYQRLKAIQHAYLTALRQLQRPPQNASEILPHLHPNGGADPAAVLRSPDDGEEYKIYWGVDALQPRGEDGQFPILAHEQRGKDGKRYVMDARHVYRKTDEEFQQVPLPKGNRPAP